MFRLLRICAFIGVVGAISGWLLVRTARAKVTQAMLDVGPHLMRYRNSEHGSKPRPMLFNGETLMLATTHTHDDLSKVLNHYEDECRGMVKQTAHALTDAKWRSIPNHRAFFEPLKLEKSDKGIVACLETPSSIQTAKDFIDRLGDVERSGDIGQLARLRYVYAEKTVSGSFIVSLWTGEHLNLKRMFQTDQDAPGNDMIDIPRPEHARRMLDFGEAGHSEHLLVYETQQTKDTLRRFYDRVMKGFGWEALNQAETHDTMDAQTFTRDGILAVVSTSTHAQKTFVTLLRTQ